MIYKTHSARSVRMHVFYSHRHTLSTIYEITKSCISVVYREGWIIWHQPVRIKHAADDNILAGLGVYLLMISGQTCVSPVRRYWSDDPRKRLAYVVCMPVYQWWFACQCGVIMQLMTVSCALWFACLFINDLVLLVVCMPIYWWSRCLSRLLHAC